MVPIGAPAPAGPGFFGSNAASQQRRSLWSEQHCCRCIGHVTSHEFLMKSLDIFSIREPGLVDAAGMCGTWAAVSYIA